MHEHRRVPLWRIHHTPLLRNIHADCCCSPFLTTVSKRQHSFDEHNGKQGTALTSSNTVTNGSKSGNSATTSSDSNDADAEECEEDDEDDEDCEEDDSADDDDEECEEDDSADADDEDCEEEDDSADADAEECEDEGAFLCSRASSGRD